MAWKTVVLVKPSAAWKIEQADKFLFSGLGYLDVAGRHLKLSVSLFSTPESLTRPSFFMLPY